MVFVILAAMVLYGFFLRVYDIGYQGLWIDEGASVMCARGIVEHGVPEVASGNVLWSAFPYHYLIAVPMKLSGSVQVVPRVISAVLGAILIVLQYFLAKKCSKSMFVGLFSAFLMAFLTYEVAWSRQVRFYMLLQVLLVAGVLQMLRFVDKRRFLDLFGAVLWLGLAVLTHRSGYILGLVFVFLGLFHWKVLLFGRRKRLPVRGGPVEWGGAVDKCGIAGADAGVLRDPARSAGCTAGALRDPARSAGCTSVWKRMAVVLGVLAGISCLFWLFLTVRSSSSLSDTFRMLTETSGTNYLWMYTVFLYEQFGWLIVLLPLGFVVGLWRNWRVFLALGLVCGAFVYVISFRTWMFAFRYLLPVFPFLLLFLAENAFFGEKMAESLEKLPKMGRKSLFLAKIVVFLAFCWLFGSQMGMSFRPQQEYWLGYTAPQPRWQEAFAMVVDREKRMYGREERIVTVSGFPMFHDIYLGEFNPEKYYLPISHTGYPDQVLPRAPYSDAKTIGSLEELLALRGYLILDDFSLRMIADSEIAQYLNEHRYNLFLEGRFGMYVWVLEGGE